MSHAAQDPSRTKHSQANDDGDFEKEIQKSGRPSEPQPAPKAAEQWDPFNKPRRKLNRPFALKVSRLQDLTPSETRSPPKRPEES